MARRLNLDEAALWARVIATVTPMPGNPLAPAVAEVSAPTTGSKRKVCVVAKPFPAAVSPRSNLTTPTTPGTSLDGSWDRRLLRGTVEPDATVDLHGHTLTSAHAMLDAALDRARARGDRVILLITGKPPRSDSERPHTRGAIRAAVGDWIHASRHAGAIAAVRGASPRHGGDGAIYIVLRRPRTAPKS